MIRTLAAGAYESYVQVCKEKKPGDLSRDKELPSGSFRREQDSEAKVASASILQHPSSSKGDKRKFKCTVCKSAGKSGEDILHKYSECPMIKQLTASNEAGVKATRIIELEEAEIESSDDELPLEIQALNRM